MTDTTANPDGAPVTWFEIGTDDPAGARSFYGPLLGWTFVEQGPYTMVVTAAGPEGGIRDTDTPQPEGTPRTFSIPYAQVADVAATCAKVEELGGKVLVQATTTPDGLVYAHIVDPAGNDLGLWTPPPA
ncbi:MAG TPA: VOC family protein [Acidimicrobiales bacterium]|nr:VOC family protein [Acidimicrobiales bacterium]